MHRHRFDPGALVAGLFFLTVAAVFFVSSLEKRLVLEPQVLAPALLAGLGIVGLIRVLTRSRRR